MIASRGEGVSNYYVSKNLNSVLKSNEFEKTQISQAEANFDDIGSIADFYDYMEQIFIPTLMIEEYANGSQIIQSADKYFIGLHNKLLGGFRMRQIRSKEASCEHPNDLKYKCFPNIFNHKKDDVDDDTIDELYPYQSGHQLGDSESFHGLLGSYIGGGQIVDFPNNKTAALALLSRLQNNDSFLSMSTRAILVDFNTYAPSLNLHSVARLSFEVPASGGILSRSEIKTWRFNRYDGKKGKMLIALEIIFVLCVISFTFEEFVELKNGGLKAYIADRWNIIDWINLFVFYIIIGWRMHGISEMSDVDLYSITHYVSLRDIQWNIQWENYLLMINGFLLWMKLFKYMTFSNRVRFLFTMLQRSSQDLLIFSIVLFVFFLAFGMAAFLSFSSDVNDFRSLSMSIVNLMRYTVTDLDYQKLRESNKFLGSFYYCAWSILMILILANVFIAILSDAYATISNETDDEEKLFQSLKRHVAKSLKAMRQNSKILNKVLTWKRRSVQSIFKQTDKNDDGQLSSKEVAQVLQIKKEKADEIIQQFDKDGDNLLNEEEVHQMKLSLAMADNMNIDETVIKKKDTVSIHEQLQRIEALMSRLNHARLHKSKR